MNNNVYKRPTQVEVSFIVEKANAKRKAKGINIVELSEILKVNYCNLTRVLSGGLTNYQIVNKLNEWINEKE